MKYPYDAELAAALALRETVPIAQLEEARREHERYFSFARDDLSGGDRLRINDRTVPAGPHGPPVRVRVFTPYLLEPPVPAVLYIHSGGFVLGSIESEHRFAANAATEAEAIVVSVGYRLAPEHPYPAALNDCYAAFLWMVSSSAELGLDPERIAVIGSSAGGGLAAGLALLARDHGGPSPCFQLLNMPVLDDRLDTPSMLAFTDTPVWNRGSAVLSWEYYLGEDRQDVPYYAAPARAPDLSGLPPAYISTAEFDPLRDEGLTYALRLLQAGVSVEVHNFAGTFHSFDVVESAELSQRQVAESHAALRRGLRASHIKPESRSSASLLEAPVASVLPTRTNSRPSPRSRTPKRQTNNTGTSSPRTRQRRPS